MVETEFVLVAKFGLDLRIEHAWYYLTELTSWWMISSSIRISLKLYRCLAILAHLSAIVILSIIPQP